MIFKLPVSLLLILVVLLSCKCDKKDTDKKNTFKATKEWQTFEKDDILPSGLHYRMNMETGKKEAKLIDLDNNEDQDTSLTYDKEKQTETVDEKVAESIRKIDDEKDLNPELRTLDSTAEASLKAYIKKGKDKDKFRNYEDLKSIFEEMNMTVDTDIDLMNRLFDNYATNTEFMITKENEKDVLNVLQDLEYLVSQIDNARHFVQRNGITKIIMPSLNASSFEIRTEALKLIGSAAQNNVPVQIKCLEQNLLQPILHLFNQLTGKDKGDHVFRLKSAAVFAISCLVRNFPTAQNDLIKHGGLNILLSEKIFDNNCENGYKLQLKIASLLNDLVQERYDATIQFNIEQSKLELEDKADELSLIQAKHQEAKSKMDQYAVQDLFQSLLDLDWCNIISSLLIKNTHSGNMEALSTVLLTNIRLCDYFTQSEKSLLTSYHEKQIRKLLTEINNNKASRELGDTGALQFRIIYDELATKNSEEGERKRYEKALGKEGKMERDEL